MQLTEQQLAELERRGYHVSGKWFHLLNRSETLEQLREVVEIAAILGIAPAGYRLVPEEVAEKAVPLIEELLQHMARSRVSLNDVEADLSKAERKHIWTALASALQGEEVEKR